MAFGGLKGTLVGGNASIPNPLPATGSVAVAVGDLVFVVVAQQTSLTVTACADNLGNTYAAVAAGTTSGVTISGRAFYSRVTVAGTLTTVNATTTSSTNDASISVAVVEGPFRPVTPLDLAPAQTTNDTTTPYTSAASGVLSQADEYIFSWMVQNATNVMSATSPNIKLVQQSQSANATSMIGGQVVSVTTSVTPAWTGTAPTANVLGTVTFRKDTGIGVGSATAAASATAVGTGIIPAAGSAAASAALTVISLPPGFDGFGFAVGGFYATQNPGIGVATATAVATGIGRATTIGAGAGAAIAVATGVGASTARSPGSAAASASASGVGASTARSVGSAAASATAAAVGSRIVTSAGSAAASASATAVGLGVALMTGSASASASASASGTAIAIGVGSAAAVASASAEYVFPPAFDGLTFADDEFDATHTMSAFGTAVATAVATGVGRATALAAGLAHAIAAVIGHGLAYYLDSELMVVEHEDRAMIVPNEDRALSVPLSGNDDVTEDEDPPLDVPVENRVMVCPPKGVVEMTVQPENRVMTVPDHVRRAA